MNNISLINKYGYKVVAFFAVCFILSMFFGGHLLFGCFLAIAIFVYRNPERMAQSDDERAILSPIDGKILSIKQSIYNNTNFTEIIIENSFFDAGVVRAMGNFQVDEIRYKNGLNLANSDSLINLLNCRVAYIGKICGEDAACRISSGAIGGGVYFENITSIKSTRRLGFIVSGRVSLYLPTKARLNVSVGDKIKGCDLIGFL